jgi:acetyl-CoA synthetase
MAADVVDDHGRSVIGAQGELVVTRSWPAMTRGLWQDPERYLESYWSRYPGAWVQGDRAIRYDDGTFEVLGRSDDVLKVAGKRVGPVELESLATEIAGVTAAAAVGVDHPTKGQVPVLVVQVTSKDGRDVETEVAERIATSFGKPLRPAAVLVVDDLPRTRSGKVHRRAVRAWVNGMDAGDLSSLENPEAEIGIRQAALGRDDLAFVEGSNR